MSHAETDSSELDDHTLMQRVATGDESAFRSLVERHQYAVVGTIGKMLGPEGDAEDVAQRVFLKVWQAAPRYRPEAKFSTWLMTIVRNMVFNDLRKRQRANLESLDAEDAGARMFVQDKHTPRPDQAALTEELADRVDAAIAALPEQQRMALVLLRYEEMSYDDIARAMECSVSAVKSLIFRARTELKNSLRPYLQRE